ncbi:MAG: TIM barrel protein, partial [Cyclobacteriaceae bacterium]
MSAKTLTDLSQLCIHTITTKPWTIEEAAKNFAASGVKGITVWRDALEGRNIGKTGESLRDQGFDIVSLCRGGFFPDIDKTKRAAAIAENKKAIDEAAELGTTMVVLVCGAEPRQSLEDSRRQIRDGIENLLP